MTNSANGMGADSSGSLASQPLRADNAPSIPLRKLHKDGYYFQDNEFTDVYSPIVGPFAAMIYERLCRNSYGNPTIEFSVRDLARGMSHASAARAIQILEIVGLIKRLPTSGNRKSVCQLFDVKALAESHGAMRLRKSAPLELPTPVFDRLKSQVRAVRQRQQGKTKARADLTGKRNVEISVQSGLHSLFSVSQRDASVSPAIRQRSTRETQTGTHLLTEERRTENVLSPTPSREQTVQKDFPNEEESEALLKCARNLFNGVIDEIRAHLLDTNTPPVPHLANGFADWQKYGFGSLAVKAAARRGNGLALVLSATDPAATRRGLEKYRRTWEASFRKSFGCKVQVALQRAVDVG
ncbi:MAG: hypothetical protein ABSF16_00035 [Terracidiphilus sp.]